MKTTMKLSMQWIASSLTAVATLMALCACTAQRGVVEPPVAAMPVVQRVQPVKLILDSDFGSSTDDLFALMMLHHYIDDGLVDLKGIIVDREGEKNALLVDVFNHYYGHTDIPVGVERNGVKNPRCFIPYSDICDLKDQQGEPLFKRTMDVSRCPDGYKLYRQLLSKAEDKSLVVVAIGFATTLSQLFLSGADEYSELNGADLFGRKVKAVYIQSGRFETNDSLAGYNMRAASRQSAVFYDKLPKSVDLIMSPSNIGDKMDYKPKDVLTDLSYTDYNPIKAVYTNFTCDTGQRMWDTNCLVNAVLGDAEYNLSPRGWVTFVDHGEESLMLFHQDPNGNARYQQPGDSYFFESKLMDIRRHNRMNRYQAKYTIEAPQSTAWGDAAVAWTKPRTQQLIDKYLGTAAGKLDPAEVLEMFRPIGYHGSNPQDYQDACLLLADTLYAVMLQRALKAGNKTLVAVVGTPACGKTTALKQLSLGNPGLIYDGAEGLDYVIAKARKAGMEKITIVPVYNDLFTSFKNALERGKQTYSYVALADMVSYYRSFAGVLQHIHAANADVEFLPVDLTGNQPARRVSLDEALRWKFDVTDDVMRQLLTYLLNEIDSGKLWNFHVPMVASGVLSIPGLSPENTILAREIDQRVKQIEQQYRMR